MIRLTDEELVLLNAVHPAVTAPYLDPMTEDSRQVALATAYRSLSVHGLAPGPDGAGLAVPEGLVRLLQARECAEAVLIVCRRAGDDEHVCYCHRSATAVVVEELDRQGIHSFHVVDEAELAGLMQEFAQRDASDSVHLEARVWDDRDQTGAVCRIGPDELAGAGERVAALLLGDGVGHNGTCDDDFQPPHGGPARVDRLHRHPGDPDRDREPGSFPGDRHQRRRS